MSYLPNYLLDEIGADIEAAVRDIGLKYGVTIRYDGPRVDRDCDYSEPDAVVMEIVTLGDEGQLSEAAKEHRYWKSIFGDGEDGEGEAS